MKRTAMAASLAMGLLAGGCVLPLDIEINGDEWSNHRLRIHGSGISATRTYAVEDFDRITTWGVGTVIVEQTGRERLTVTGDDNVLPHLDIESRSGTLMIGPESGVDLSLRNELVFHVEVVDLKRINASGAVQLDADLGWHSTFSALLSGVTSLDVTGSVDVLDVVISGVSRFGGRDFQGREVKVVVSGVSSAVVWATERLEGAASGTSAILYRGSPDVDVAVSGLATVGRY